MSMKRDSLRIMVMMLTSSVAGAEQVDWQTRRAGLGRTEKYRILVDKVLISEKQSCPDG